MNTAVQHLDPQQQVAVDALVAIGNTPEEAIGVVLGSAGHRPTVAEAAERYLTMSTENTRRTYATHLNRLVGGAGPICDQNCEPCVTPVSTVARNADGKARGRRLVFECRCDCRPCRDSRSTVPAMGDRPVSATC